MIESIKGFFIPRASFISTLLILSLVLYGPRQTSAEDVRSSSGNRNGHNSPILISDETSSQIAPSEKATGEHSFDHTMFYPFFADLEGWRRSQFLGWTDRETGNTRTACSYRQESRSIVARVTAGHISSSIPDKNKPGCDNASETRIDGFQALFCRTPSPETEVWTMYLKLDGPNNAVATLSFQSLALEECVRLAEQFDWRSIAECLERLTVKNTAPPEEPSVY